MLQYTHSLLCGFIPVRVVKIATAITRKHPRIPTHISVNGKNYTAILYTTIVGIYYKGIIFIIGIICVYDPHSQGLVCN